MRIEITADTARVSQALASLGGQAPFAVTRALNRSRDQGATVLVKALADDTTLSQSVVRKALSTRDATSDNQVATIDVSRKRIPLIEFGARQTRLGVTYRLPSGRGFIKSAFITTVGAGHRGVFKRKGKARLPIEEKAGPSLAFVTRKNLNIQEIVRARLNEVWPPNVDHEIEFLAKQLGLYGREPGLGA